MSQQTIHVFFSWQSDLSRKSNSNLIRLALMQAKYKLEESYPNIHINIDEATKNETGSPDIIETILRKIDNCDFYIADMSIINNENNNNKKMPNPNVLFECGYALNTLGWERITLLFNNHFGELESLPFDLPRRRISTYTAKPESSEKELKSNKIYELVEDILLGCIESIDRLPSVTRKTDITAIKNQRDIKSLKTFFSCFDVYSIQKLCQDLPEYIDDSEIHSDYVINLEYQIQGLDFHIYNKKLNKLIKDFTRLYINLIQRCGFTHEPITQYSYPYRCKFINQSMSDTALNQEQQEVYDNIKKQAQMLFKKLKKILDIVRKEDVFIDVDIDSLGQQAYQNYYKQMLETKKEIEKISCGDVKE